MTDKYDHTPLPLTVVNKIQPEDEINDGSIIFVDNGQAYCVAKAPQFQTIEKWKKDAEFIVNACNNYYKLLESAKEAKEVYNLAISLTPTGPKRNALTDKNILRMLAINNAEA